MVASAWLRATRATSMLVKSFVFLKYSDGTWRVDRQTTTSETGSALMEATNLGVFFVISICCVVFSDVFYALYVFVFFCCFQLYRVTHFPAHDIFS